MMALLFGVATIAGVISCGNKGEKASEETTASYAQTERDYGMRGSSSQSTQRTSRDTYSEESRKVEKADKLSICNTKWSFTDAQGNGFILRINGMSRDGESAKMELEKNGTVIVYGTVKPRYRDWHKTDFMGYEFDEGSCDATISKIYYTSSDYHWIGTSLWDYEEGFLYSDQTAYDAEALTRLKIKKVK